VHTQLDGALLRCVTYARTKHAAYQADSSHAGRPIPPLYIRANVAVPFGISMSLGFQRSTKYANHQKPLASA